MEHVLEKLSWVEKYPVAECLICNFGTSQEEKKHHLRGERGHGFRTDTGTTNKVTY
jgi:hypothetical protein